jgi:hypothetical protein
MGQAPTGVEVRAKTTPLGFILHLLHPKFEIDGQLVVGKWGSQFFPLAPGSHTFNFWYTWIMGPANKATIDVSVYEGQVVVVTYKTRWLVFLPGKVSAAPATA